MINKVKIDAVTYDVLLSSGPLLVENKACKGMIEYDQNRISILDSLGKSQSMVTLMHEVVHGIVRERGLDLTNSTEEVIVDELGKAMLQLIRDNNDLITLIKTSG